MQAGRQATQHKVCQPGSCTPTLGGPSTDLATIHGTPTTGPTLAGGGYRWQERLSSVTSNAGVQNTENIQTSPGRAASGHHWCPQKGQGATVLRAEDPASGSGSLQSGLQPLTKSQKILEPRFFRYPKIGWWRVHGGAQMLKRLARSGHFCLLLFLFHGTANSRIMCTLTVLFPVALKLGKWHALMNKKCTY